MKIGYREIEGDLLDLFDTGEFEMIAHGCNCLNVMGAGIAKQIKERYPEAYYADKYYWFDCKEKLSNYSFTEDFTICNLYTQLTPGPYLDYEALTLCLRKLNMDFPGMSLGLPQIGCGLAGGDWAIVREIIKKELRDMNVTVVIFKNNKNED